MKLRWADMPESTFSHVLKLFELTLIILEEKSWGLRRYLQSVAAVSHLYQFRSPYVCILKPLNSSGQARNNDVFFHALFK